MLIHAINAQYSFDRMIDTLNPSASRSCRLLCLLSATVRC